MTPAAHVPPSLAKDCTGVEPSQAPSTRLFCPLPPTPPGRQKPHCSEVNGVTRCLSQIRHRVPRGQVLSVTVGTSREVRVHTHTHTHMHTHTHLHRKPGTIRQGPCHTCQLRFSLQKQYFVCSFASPWPHCLRYLIRFHAGGRGHTLPKIIAIILADGVKWNFLPLGNPLI